MLALGLSSEYFWRAGWDVDCCFAQNDDELAARVRKQHFDVLDLSLSMTFRRDHCLPAMGDSVRRVRHASRNRALGVLVSGRIFFEHPELCCVVDADGGYGTASHVAPLAESLVVAMLTRSFAKTQQVLRNEGARIAAKALRTGTLKAA